MTPQELLGHKDVSTAMVSDSSPLEEHHAFGMRCLRSTRDAFAAHLKSHGFVGVGRIRSRAKRSRDVKIQRSRAISCLFAAQGEMSGVVDTSSEYICLVDRLAWFPRSKLADAAPELYAHNARPCIPRQAAGNCSISNRA